MSQDTLKIVYSAFVHSVMNCGLIYWWNSSNNANIFNMQKIIFRIFTESIIRDLFTSASAFTIYAALFVFMANSNNNNNFKMYSDACNIIMTQKINFTQLCHVYRYFKQERLDFSSTSHYSPVLHYPVRDKFYPWILYEIYFILGFVDERIGAYQNHRLLVSPYTSIPHPTHQECEMQCWERGNISHSSYSWPPTLLDVLFMNRHTIRRLRITGWGRAILFIFT